MKVKMVAIEDVVPYARNPRKNMAAITKVSASLKEFGWQQPIVVDKEMVVIAGHTRLEAAWSLKYKKVPVQIADKLTDAQVKAYRIADNRVSQEAEWDIDLLKLELSDLDGLDYDLLLTGFDDDELNGMLIEAVEEGLTDEDEAPPLPEQPVSVLGDVWTLGNHRLMCGDSTSVDEVEKLLSKLTVDCVVTDPPYNQATEGGSNHDIGAALQSQSNNIGFMCEFEPKTWLPVVAAFFPKGKMNLTIFCNKDLVPDYLAWARDHKYSFNILIWKKPNAIPLGSSYMPDVEYCLVFKKSGIFNSSIPNVSYSKVLEYGRDRGLHPTMKPVAMLENQIKIVSKLSGIVVDYFGGSGSTLIACEKTGRHCRMMELDEKYVDVVISRWQDFTGKEAVHAETGKTYNEMKAERHGS